MSATIVDDNLVENDETVIVTLSSPSNSTLGPIPAHTYSITNDDVGPAAFTVGTVTTTGGTVVSGYWNASNTGLDVVVPVENNTNLVGGTIQLQAKKSDLSFENLGDSHTIVSGDIAGSKTMSVTAAQFEAITGFAEDATISITAIITDKFTNSTTGTASSTTIKVDQTAPTAFTVGAVTPLGGTIVGGYWNSTNTSVTVAVPMETSDGSLAGGTLQLQGKRASVASYENVAILPGSKLHSWQRGVVASLQLPGADSGCQISDAVLLGRVVEQVVHLERVGL